jgi:hypothetical protein
MFYGWFSGDTEENNKIISRSSLHSRRNLNPEAPEHAGNLEFRQEFFEFSLFKIQVMIAGK